MQKSCCILSMGPSTRKMRNTCNHIFHAFLIFRVVGPIESMQHGYSLDEELNYESNKCSRSKVE